MTFVMSEFVDTLEHWLPTTILLVRLTITIGRTVRALRGVRRKRRARTRPALRAARQTRGGDCRRRDASIDRRRT
jgi:hypothetical protein